MPLIEPDGVKRPHTGMPGNAIMIPSFPLNLIFPFFAAYKYFQENVQGTGTKFFPSFLDGFLLIGSPTREGLDKSAPGD
jgi:hypothetical protein